MTLCCAFVTRPTQDLPSCSIKGTLISDAVCQSAKHSFEGRKTFTHAWKRLQHGELGPATLQQDRIGKCQETSWERWGQLAQLTNTFSMRCHRVYACRHAFGDPSDIFLFRLRFDLSLNKIGVAPPHPPTGLYFRNCTIAYAICPLLKHCGHTSKYDLKQGARVLDPEWSAKRGAYSTTPTAYTSLSLWDVFRDCSATAEHSDTVLCHKAILAVILVICVLTSSVVWLAWRKAVEVDITRMYCYNYHHSYWLLAFHSELVHAADTWSDSCLQNSTHPYPSTQHQHAFHGW